MSQTRASIPYVTAFTPQENSNVSPNGSMSKLTILQPFGVNPDSAFEPQPYCNMVHFCAPLTSEPTTA